MNNYIGIHIYIYIYTSKLSSSSSRACVCVFVRVCVCVHIRMYVYVVCTWVHECVQCDMVGCFVTRAHTHVHTHTYTHPHTQTHTHTPMHVCPPGQHLAHVPATETPGRPALCACAPTPGQRYARVPGPTLNIKASAMHMCLPRSAQCAWTRAPL
jgi:hypothetical protein